MTAPASVWNRPPNPYPNGNGHSRKGSLMVGGGMDIQRGNLAFGTVDSPNPLLSSSPAAPSITGTHLADNVKSFGSIEADSTDPNSIKRREDPPQAKKQPDIHAMFAAKPTERRQSMNGPQYQFRPPRSPVMSPPTFQARPPYPRPMQQQPRPMGPYPGQYMYPQGYYPGYDYQQYPQWAPQQHPHAPPHMPSQPSSNGPSPVPTPPARPPVLMPSTPSRPTQPLNPNSSFTPSFNMSGGASTFTPRASKAIKISTPDGTEVNLKAIKPATPVATPEPEPTPKKLTLPVVVRLESEEQKKQRLKEEADREKIRAIEAKEEQERKERKERQAKEAEEKAKEAEARAEKAAEAKAEAEKAEAEKAEAEKAEAEKAEAEKAEAEKAEADRLGAEAKAAEAKAAETKAKEAEESAEKEKAAEAEKAEIKDTVETEAKDTPEKPETSHPRASALTSAKPIEDLTSITYPSTFNPPSPRLNANAEPGKFRYDRDFLMQFMQICQEKPEGLPSLEEIGLEADSSSGFGRAPRGGSRPPPRAPTTGIRPPPSMGAFGMGNFGAGTLRGTTSDDRYQRSLQARMPNMARTPSQGLPPMASSTSRSGISRSQRGGRRPVPTFEPDVAPLAVSENSWVKARPTDSDESSPGFVERKVKSLLNKLTQEKFASISAQILEWANHSKNETDGMSLKLVIKQVFDKATDEAHWSEMYARLCRLLLDRLDPEVSETIDGKPTAGGVLFRKYLIGRCQMDFEAGWRAREIAVSAAAAKSQEDKERLAKAEQDKEQGKEGEAAMLSEEYYAAQKAKRRGLGLVQLIGELYKLQMISKKVIGSCLGKLLTNLSDPDEEDIESTCKLLTTVGEQYEQQSPERMPEVIGRLEIIMNLESTSSRAKFMIMDILDLRRNHWRSKKTQSSVMTIAQIHQEAAKEQAQQAQKTAANRESLSRGGSRAGRTRNDEWQSVQQPARLPQRIDTSKLGTMTSSGAAPTFAGPASVFNKKKIGTPPISRQASTANMFSALNEGEAEPERKKLQLQPRTLPTEDQEEEKEEETAAVMSTDEAKTKIASDMKELWGEKDQGGSRNPDDIVEYFKALPEEKQPLLAVQLVDDVFRLAKYKDAEVVAKGLQLALENKIPLETLLKGVDAHMPGLDDDSIDFPQAYKAVALLMRSLSLSDDDMSAQLAKVDVYGEPKITPKDKFAKALASVDEERA